MVRNENARILIVDDEKMNLRVLAELLKDEYAVILAKNGEQALKHARDKIPPDLILLDVVMPEMGGHEVIKQLKDDDRTQNIPVIFVTALGATEEEELGLKLGAVDYIAKPFSPPIVKMRVRNHLRFVHQYKLLEQMVHLDGLTEIPNRRRFEDVFAKESGRAARNRSPLTLAMVDVDFFKQYNDHYGHAMGDRALQAVAAALRDSLKRPADLAARYGGEEFVMVLPETDAEAGRGVAERARIAVEEINIPHLFSTAADHVTVSIGVAVLYPESDISPETALKIADQNLYRAKQEGRNRVVAG
jgi:diguanylate cyclase (GGDEF)-like protein